jgi:hypothetical protein
MIYNKMKNQMSTASGVSEASKMKILDDKKHNCLLKCSKKNPDSKVPGHRGGIKLCMDQCMKESH